MVYFFEFIMYNRKQRFTSQLFMNEEVDMECLSM